MKTSLNPQDKTTKILTRLEKAFDLWWVKFFVGPVIQVLPLALFARLMMIPVGEEEGRVAALHQFSLDNPLLATTIIVLLSVILNGLLAAPAYLLSRLKRVEGHDLMTLFVVLEKVVGSKAQRFESWAVQANRENGALTSGEIFDKITQPREQINLIWQGIYTFFDTIDKGNVKLDLFVASVENGCISEWEFEWPKSTPPWLSLGNVKKGHPLYKCLEKKRIIVVDDITQPIKIGRKKDGQPLHDEEGSAICYPIHCEGGRTIPYVIVLRASKKGYFKTSHKELYDWIFSHFKIRVSLEHSLLTLKKTGKAYESRTNERRESAAK
ncbi:conserved hypothetical protein [Halomonas sp. A3H3]|jgi:hypothetical protein|uniref:hypothetical protein n=1 Tax=Halomonadaceae TaxID=28256 RepID=UPI00038D6872|nr:MULTISPECIES: hypothetical protein [Halomonas]CDG51214.1 conserved hypothetical protein [Halomonas sp. A3H3]SDJ03239.1 hypothetical protein SAMN04487867_12140 [Halomonas titanicae]|tara:strand:- start:1643 stop:2617 length:975 start_codon:yes stop_codon:yes gene_type:complete